MTNTPHDSLDAEELLHIALAASKQGRSEDVIRALKRAIELAPEDGRLHYMLGAEHAQLGLYERAIEEMHRAVEIAPQLDTAHFQLGLLHITSGRVQEAADAWRALDGLGEANPLYLFKTGLLHLARNEFQECGTYLRRGMAANTSNAALNKDMERVLSEVVARQDATTSGQQGGKAKSPKFADNLLSAYRKSELDTKEH